MNPMNRLCLYAVLLLIAVLHACAGGPTPADVAADRDRWTAVRDVARDNLVDGIERPALDELLRVWDQKLMADEAAIVSTDTTVRDLIRVYGIAAVQVFLAPEIQARAPELFRLIDRNMDGTLDEAELLAVDPKSPVFAVVVLSTAARLLARGA